MAVDFLAAKGCDGMLFSLIQKLVNEGIVKIPVTGRSGIDGEQILYRRR